MAQAVNLTDGVPLAAPFDRNDAAALLRALCTQHSGTARPAVLGAGGENEGLWIEKSSATAWNLRYWDGVSDILLGTINPTAHTWVHADAEIAAIAALASAANKLPYYTGAGTAALADISAAGRALIDDPDATAQRATLGLTNSTTVGGVPRYIGPAGEQGQAPSVYIDGTTGYLGLGTATPVSRCEVYGNTGLPSAQIRVRAEGVPGGITLHYNNTGGAHPLAGDRLGYVMFGTIQAGASKHGGSIVAHAEANYSDTSWPTYFAFETSPVGVVTPRVERMRITAGGNVGIGTPSPSCALDVAGPIRCGSYTVGTVPSASAVGAGAQIYISNESGGAVIAFSDGTNWRRVTDRAVIS